MAEHPKTEVMRAMANKHPLPREVAEVLYLAAAEIDHLRAAAQPAAAELCERGCGEPAHPHRTSYQREAPVEPTPPAAGEGQ